MAAEAHHLQVTPGYTLCHSFHSGRTYAMGQHWIDLSTCLGKTRSQQPRWCGVVMGPTTKAVLWCLLPVKILWWSA